MGIPRTQIHSHCAETNYSRLHQYLQMLIGRFTVAAAAADAVVNVSLFILLRTLFYLSCKRVQTCQELTRGFTASMDLSSSLSISLV